MHLASNPVQPKRGQKLCKFSDSNCDASLQLTREQKGDGEIPYALRTLSSRQKTQGVVARLIRISSWTLVQCHVASFVMECSTHWREKYSSR